MSRFGLGVTRWTSSRKRVSRCTPKGSQCPTRKRCVTVRKDVSPRFQCTFSVPVFSVPVGSHDGCFVWNKGGMVLAVGIFDAAAEPLLGGRTLRGWRSWGLR